MIKKIQMKYGELVVNEVLWDDQNTWNPGLQYTLIDVTDSNSPVTLQTGDTGIGVNHYAPANIVMPQSSEITSYEFFNLFTKDERLAIRAASKVSADLEDWLSLAQAAQTIDLTHPDVDAGLSMIVGAGLLTSDRKTQILNNGV